MYAAQINAAQRSVTLHTENARVHIFRHTPSTCTHAHTQSCTPCLHIHICAHACAHRRAQTHNYVFRGRFCLSKRLIKLLEHLFPYWGWQSPKAKLVDAVLDQGTGTEQPAQKSVMDGKTDLCLRQLSLIEEVGSGILGKVRHLDAVFIHPHNHVGIARQGNLG